MDRMLTIQGHTIAVSKVTSGRGEIPRILVHGITASCQFWTPDIVPEQVAKGSCYAVSLPAHFPAQAPAKWGTADISAASMAQILEDSIQQLVGDQPVLLMGHSTGGFAALALAALYPQRAAKVISVAGFAHGRWTGMLGLRQRLAAAGPIGRALFRLSFTAAQRTPRTFSRSARWAAADMASVLNYPSANTITNTNYEIFKHLDLKAMTAYFQKMPQIDISNELPDIAAPTLALAGDADPIVPFAQSQKIAQLVPHATLSTIAGAGHLPFWERPSAYHEAINQWLVAGG